MLDNCYKFNGIGSDIANLGKQLEAIFNQKWAEKSNFLAQHGDFGKVKTSHDFDEDEFEDGPNGTLYHVIL